MRGKPARYVKGSQNAPGVLQTEEPRECSGIQRQLVVIPLAYSRSSGTLDSDEPSRDMGTMQWTLYKPLPPNPKRLTPILPTPKPDERSLYFRMVLCPKDPCVSAYDRLIYVHGTFGQWSSKKARKH